MKLYYLMCLAILSISCNKLTEIPSYVIKGTIDGISSGRIILQGSAINDTVFIRNGKFEFKGTLEEPCLAKIFIDGKDNIREFYLENSIIEFKGNIDSIDKSIITGSRTEDERILYNNKMYKFNEKYAEIEKKYENADEIREAELDLLYEKVELEQVNAQIQFIQENPSSYLCIPILWGIDWSFNSTVEYNKYVNLLDTSLNKYA